VDGQAIGYQRVFWRQEAEGDRVYGHFGYLRPAWRRRGIGRAMLHHAEHRLRALAREHGPLPRQLLQTEVAESEVGANALLRSEGYALVRYAFIMVRPLQEPIPETDLPAGLEVRPVRADQYQAVWEAADEAFRDHWGYHPQTEADYSIWRENRRFQPDLWQVAWQGDQVAGMVLNFIDAEENQRFSRRRGYTENICVRRPWRRRGLARALILRSLALLHDRGLQEASLGVDAENRSGALSLYEGVGFRPVQVFNFYRKPIDFGQTPTATGIPAA
jgi:ribosomal protein S18 acetylase RimI-like enzyme